MGGEELVIRYWEVKLWKQFRRDALGAVGEARLCVASDLCRLTGEGSDII